MPVGRTHFVFKTPLPDNISLAIMHDALYIDEIIQRILSEFRIRGTIQYKSCNKLTLARVARTCKTLTGPALDLLWEKQVTMANLFKVLPSFQLGENMSYVSLSNTYCLRCCLPLPVRVLCPQSAQRTSPASRLMQGVCFTWFIQPTSSYIRQCMIVFFSYLVINPCFHPSVGSTG